MANQPVKFGDLHDAYMYCSASRGEAAAYLCRETGIVHWDSDALDIDPLPDDYEDGTKYIAIPDKYELNLGNQLVFEFTEAHLPDRYEKVRHIFRRPGAYARFKDLLDAHDALQRWYDYENSATEKALREWCAANGIEIQDEAVNSP